MTKFCFILCYNNDTGEFLYERRYYLTDDELVDLIMYGLQENGVPLQLIHHFPIYCTIQKYRQLSTLIEKEYDGRLTTFQYASYFLIALSESRIIRDREIMPHLHLIQQLRCVKSLMIILIMGLGVCFL